MSSSDSDRPNLVPLLPVCIVHHLWTKGQTLRKADSGQGEKPRIWLEVLNEDHLSFVQELLPDPQVHQFYGREYYDRDIARSSFEIWSNNQLARNAIWYCIRLEEQSEEKIGLVGVMRNSTFEALQYSTAVLVKAGYVGNGIAKKAFLMIREELCDTFGSELAKEENHAPVPDFFDAERLLHSWPLVRDVMEEKRYADVRRTIGDELMNHLETLFPTIQRVESLPAREKWRIRLETYTTADTTAYRDFINVVNEVELAKKIRAKPNLKAAFDRFLRCKLVLGDFQISVTIHPNNLRSQALATSFGCTTTDEVAQAVVLNPSVTTAAQSQRLTFCCDMPAGKIFRPSNDGRHFSRSTSTVLSVRHLCKQLSVNHPANVISLHLPNISKQLVDRAVCLIWVQAIDPSLPSRRRRLLLADTRVKGRRSTFNENGSGPKGTILVLDSLQPFVDAELPIPIKLASPFLVPDFPLPGSRDSPSEAEVCVLLCLPQLKSDGVVIQNLAAKFSVGVELAIEGAPDAFLTPYGKEFLTRWKQTRPGSTMLVDDQAHPASKKRSRGPTDDSPPQNKRPFSTQDQCLQVNSLALIHHSEEAHQQSVVPSGLGPHPGPSSSAPQDQANTTPPEPSHLDPNQYSPLSFFDRDQTSLIYFDADSLGGLTDYTPLADGSFND